MIRLCGQIGRIHRFGGKSQMFKSIIKTNSFNFAQILEKVHSSNEDEEAFKISEEAIQKQPEKLDLFQENMKLEKLPDNMIAYNDLDDNLSLEFLKEIDLSNLTNIPLLLGRFSRVYCFTEDLIHSIIMYMSNNMGLGIGISTMVFALGIRILMSPVTILNYKHMQINKLLGPDITEMNKNISEYRRLNKQDLVRLETNKLNQLRIKHGAKQSKIKMVLGFFNMLTLAVWAGLVQRFSLNIEDYPEIMTGGFLWFKDLTLSDPYFIIPFINAVFVLLNLISNPGIPGNSLLIKMRKFYFVFPLFTFPVLCTFETGFLLYLTTSSFAAFLITTLCGTKYMKKLMKINNFLPGTKLERMNPMNNIGSLIQKSNLNKL